MSSYEQFKWERDIAMWQRMQEWIDTYSKNQDHPGAMILLSYAKKQQEEILSRNPGKEKFFTQ